MLSNYLIVQRPCTRLLRRKAEEHIRIAVDEAFTDLKKLVDYEPDFGRVSGPDRTPVSQLDRAPESWVSWFGRDGMIMLFTSKNRPERIVMWSPGTPGQNSAQLSVMNEPDLMNDPVWLRKMLAAAIPIWGAHEGKVLASKNNVSNLPWLYWLKAGREPVGYNRRPMPEGWSRQSDLHDGVLYEWPENRPNGARKSEQVK